MAGPLCLPPGGRRALLRARDAGYNAGLTGRQLAL